MEIGIVYEKGRKEGRFWKIGERNRFKKECCFWHNIIKNIDLEISEIGYPDSIFDEMLILAKEYDIKNYYRILNMKDKLKEYYDNMEYSKKELIFVNEILNELLFDFNTELSKFNGKNNAYRILEAMHNFPKIFHGKDILGGGEAVSIEDAVKYSTWCMTDAMKSKYNFDNNKSK